MAQIDITAALSARRRQLSDDLDRLTRPPESGVGVSFGKRIGDGTTEAVERLSTTATARSLAASIADIDRALAKLGEGSYGRCDDCGSEIPSQRLEARPSTALCVGCSSLRRGTEGQ